MRVSKYLCTACVSKKLQSDDWVICSGSCKRRGRCRCL